MGWLDGHASQILWFLSFSLILIITLLCLFDLCNCTLATILPPPRVYFYWLYLASCDHCWLLSIFYSDQLQGSAFRGRPHRKRSIAENLFSFSFIKCDFPPAPAAPRREHKSRRSYLFSQSLAKFFTWSPSGIASVTPCRSSPNLRSKPLFLLRQIDCSTYFTGA